MNTVDSGANPSTIAGGVVHPEVVNAPHRAWARSIAVSTSVIATACILFLIITYARQKTDQLPPGEAALEPVSAVSPAAVSVATARNAWRYSTERNAAGQAERVGCVESGGRVFLGEPYSSEHASLCFRADGMAYLRLEGDGRISSGAGYDAKIQVAEDPVQTVATLKAGDQALGVAILSPATPLLAAAKGGKPITVTATYDEDVTQALTFAPQEPLKLDE